MDRLDHGSAWQEDLTAASSSHIRRLDRPARRLRGDGLQVQGKAEFMTTGESMKDRAGLSSSPDAEQRWACCSQGGTIVEGTAGNTGMA